MSKKPIIVFEGIEGSGKSYHLKNVEKFLKKKKYKYLKIREPGGSKNSELIRKIILNKKSNFTKNTDLLLYLAARSENVSLLKENYKKRIILIDRFVDSTLAYQHYGMGVNFNLIQLINKFLLKNIKVSFTFLNIVNKKNMNLRLKKRNTLNRYDTFNDGFYKKVQDGFIKLSKKNPKKYQIVDSNLDVNENKKKIFQKIIKIIR